MTPDTSFPHAPTRSRYRLALAAALLCLATAGPAGAQSGAVTGNPAPPPEVKTPLKPPKTPGFGEQAAPERPSFPGGAKALVAPAPADLAVEPTPPPPSYGDLPAPVVRSDLPARSVDRPPSVAPHAVAVDPDGALTLVFPDDSEALDGPAQTTLAGVAQRLQQDPGRRLQVHGYAPVKKEGGENVARRLALKRALAVRSYLMDAGIRKERLVLYANLAGKGDAGTDRVEVTFGR